MKKLNYSEKRIKAITKKNEFLRKSSFWRVLNNKDKAKEEDWRKLSFEAFREETETNNRLCLLKVTSSKKIMYEKLQYVDLMKRLYDCLQNIEIWPKNGNW